MATIAAYFAVGGSTFRAVELDIEGKTPEQIAELVDRNSGYVSLCHQCAPECQGPELELTGFTANGVEYIRRDGKWVTG